MSTFGPDSDPGLIIPPKTPWRRRLPTKGRVLIVALVAFFCLFDVVGFAVLAAPRSSNSSALPPSSPVRTPVLSGNASINPTPPASAANASITQTLRVPTLPPAIATTQSALSVPSPAAGPGVYVTGLQIEPSPPHRGQDLTFRVQIMNTGSALEAYRWAVFLFHATDLRHPLGETPATTANIPGGSSIIVPKGTWRLSANGPCENVIVQVGRLVGPGSTTWLTQLEGSTFQQALTLCP